jgi:hypothetical protein
MDSIEVHEDGSIRHKILRVTESEKDPEGNTTKK